MSSSLNYFWKYKSEREKIITIISLNEMFYKGIPPFRTIKSALMSLDEEKRLSVNYPKTFLC